MSRRALLQGGITGVLAAAGLTGYEIYQARYVNPYSPQLERVDLTVPVGSEGLAGMKIGFITDTHVGPFVETGDLYRALDLIRAESPDLILLGGDYISESPRYAPETAAAIADLLSDAPLGGYGVIGNHDLSVSRTRVQEALVTVGIPVLRNQTTVVTYRGAQLAIAGIDEKFAKDRARDHFGSQISDAPRHRHRGPQIADGFMAFQQVAANRADHVETAHLDSAEAELLAQVPASQKVVDCGSHAPFAVMGISEAAQGPGLPFGIAGLACPCECQLVFRQARVDLARCEEQATSIIRDLCEVSPGACAARA